MAIPVANLFAALPVDASEEQFSTLFQNGAIEIERIVSRSHKSAPGFWYDQAEEEWVMVLRGRAVLEFAGGEKVELKENDYIAIPSHVRHRVDYTDAETVWLAVHGKK